VPTTPTEEEQLATDADPAAGDAVTGGTTDAGTTGDATRTATPAERGPRIALPLVPVLSGLLVLLLAGLGFLWFTRPEPSAIRTDAYTGVLQAARSAVVDFTSFDHLTYDDDVEQVRRVSTEEFAEQSVASLEDRRQQILDLQAVVNTEVIGAGVTTADEDDATVALLIQTTRRTNTSEQADVVRFTIQVTMERPDDRWLLAGIAGTGSE
jgi:Mce-associated membrane protein